MIWYIILIVCVLAFCNKFYKPFFYWKTRKVFHTGLFVRLLKVFLGDASFPEIISAAYENFPDRRYYGSYEFFRPTLVLRDLELIKKVTVKDFDNFHDHSTIIRDETIDPVASQNLFALKGQKWRDMRATLSPAFTGSKMRQMFSLMVPTAENFTNYFLEKAENTKIEVEIKEFYSKYTNDVIATCAFGIECDSLRNKDNDFFTTGNVLSDIFRGRAALRGLFVLFFPTVTSILRISLFPTAVGEFFQKIVKDTIAYREKESIVRPDLIHLLMQARKGQLKSEENETENVGFAAVEESKSEKNITAKTELTDDLITAQALVFFFAGFETSSTLLAFLSYELAINPDIQEKLQNEIDQTLKKTNGKLDYDEILKMKYLDQVVTETLRKYPPAFSLNRVCTKNYFIPAKNANENDLWIDKGCLAFVPVYGLHMHAKYFPNPEKFIPERFSDENKSNIVPGSFMPFGSGPRNCIGSRFALLETKTLVVSLFSKLRMVPVEKTMIPIKFAKTAVLSPKGALWLGLEKRTA